MNKAFLFFTFLLSLITAKASDEIIEVKLFDGEKIKGKLWMPEKITSLPTIVIFVHGTGPGTFLNHRKFSTAEFDYYGMFAKEFNRRGIVFFSYNRRGVDTSSKAPYEVIDRDKFKKYLPLTEAKDVGACIKVLRADKRFKKSNIILLGWSEGSIIAPLVAADVRNKVKALFLAGYANERMDSVIAWQHSGESSMRAIRKYFDKNADNIIDRKEYESDDAAITAIRTKAMKNARFEQLDFNKDSLITTADFKIQFAPKYNELQAAYKRRDADWIWNNYFHVSLEWLDAHAELKPNKVTLPAIAIPVNIFHGEDDANCNVDGVYQVEKVFRENNKTNLQSFIFKGHDHNLNFTEWAVQNKLSEGITKIFTVAEEISKQ